MPGPTVSRALAEPGEDLPSWVPFTPQWGRQASEGVRGRGAQEPQEASRSSLTPLCSCARLPRQLAGSAGEMLALHQEQPWAWVSRASVGVEVVPELQLRPPSLRCPCTPLSTPGEQLCQQLCTDRWTDCEKGSGETFSVSGLGRKKARNATSSIPPRHM